MSNRAVKRGSSKSSSKKKKSRKKNSSSVKYEELPLSPGKKIFNIVWNLVFYTVMIGIFVGAVVFKFDNSPTKSLYGYHFMTVKTDSMAPNKEKPELTDGFPSGSFIIVKRTDPNKLKVGDIITFFPIEGNTDAYLTHRIIEMNTPIDVGGEETVSGITTEGDANDGPDYPIKKEAVVGKVVFSMPGIGKFVDFVRAKYIVVGAFILALFGFAIALRRYMVIPRVEERKKRRK